MHPQIAAATTLREAEQSNHDCKQKKCPDIISNRSEEVGSRLAQDNRSSDKGPKMLPEDEGKYAFITSTPSFSAKEKKETRTLVRKHVMRPYMKQKQNHTRPKRVNGLKVIAPRIPAPEVQSNPNIEAEQLDEENDPPIVPQTSSMMILGSGRVNPLQAYPIAMDVKQHELVHFIWQYSETAAHPFRQFWYPLGLVDAAGMHLVLSNAAVQLDVLRGKPAEGAESVMHYYSAIKSVNRRLGSLETSTEGPTDGILGAILGQARADARSFWIHHAGFRKVLALRGGLSSIEMNIHLRLSLFWIEHNMLSDLDVPPSFPPPYKHIAQLYIPSHEEQGEVHFSQLFASLGDPSRIGSDMLDIMKSLSILTVMINEECKKRNMWMDENFPGLCIYPVLSRVLTVQTMVKNDLEELLRIGAMLFVSETRRKFGVGPIRTRVLVSKLRRLFENTASWEEDERRLKIWVLVMAVCAASSSRDYQWAVNALREVMSVGSWDDIVREGKRMWYVEEIFGNKLLKLRREIFP
ncbi:peptidase M14 protein [Rutstroemia sp. NJR-2017a BVV2]|nr:peptidase M14 protein [Rutstroemia sp. NJR-2017a BVV2]